MQTRNKNKKRCQMSSNSAIVSQTTDGGCDHILPCFAFFIIFTADLTMFEYMCVTV